MTKKKAEILSNHMFVDGVRRYQGETVEMDEHIIESIIAGDKEAGRADRLRVIRRGRPKKND